MKGFLTVLICFDGLTGGDISSLGVPVKSSGHKNPLWGSGRISPGAMTARFGAESLSCKSGDPGWAPLLSGSPALTG